MTGSTKLAKNRSRLTFRSFLVLLLALGLVAAACGDDSDSTPPTTTASVTETTPAPTAPPAPPAQAGAVSFIMITFFTDCSFCQTVEAGALAAGEALGVDVQIVQPGGVDAATLNPALLTAVAAEPDGIGISYFEKGQETAVIEAVDKGIPVVLFNNNRFEQQGDDANTATRDPRVTSLPYVGQDETVSGAVLMSALLPLVGDGKVVIFSPAPGATVLTLRADGVKRVLDANGIEWDELDGVLDEVQNKVTISAYLDVNDDVAAIIGLGNPASNPSSVEIGERGLDIPIGTFDVDTAAILHIRNGLTTAALNQQPWLQGYFTILNLYVKVVLGLNPVNVDTGTQVVTAANVDELQASIDAGRN